MRRLDSLSVLRVWGSAKSGNFANRGLPTKNYLPISLYGSPLWENFNSRQRNGMGEFEDDLRITIAILLYRNTCILSSILDQTSQVSKTC